MEELLLFLFILGIRHHTKSNPPPPHQTIQQIGNFPLGIYKRDRFRDQQIGDLPFSSLEYITDAGKSSNPESQSPKYTCDVPRD